MKSLTRSRRTVIASMDVQNFLSFGTAAFDFRNVGLTLVEGVNGVGKSAMIDALVWCLFGTTLRGYENDEVVHRKVGEDCLVSVFIESGGRAYAINRARQHSKFKNRLSITNDDGEDMSGASNAETQLVVEKLLGCTRRTFLSSVVFGQDRAYRFSSLTDKDQKEILDEVLGVERFAQACSAARASVATVTSTISILQRDLEKVDGLHATMAADVEEMRDKDASFETDRKGKLKVEREKLAKAKEWIKHNAAINTDKLNVAVEKAQKLVTTAEKDVATNNKALTEAKIARGAIKTKLDDLHAKMKKRELTGDCPTCGQQVDGKRHKHMIADLKKQAIHVAAVYEKANEVVSEFDSAWDEANRKLTTARVAASTAQKALNEAVAETANAIAWRRRVADHEERIAELSKETNPYAALAKKAEVQRDRYAGEAKLLTTQLGDEEAKLKLAAFWVQAFGAKGLRSLLLDSSLPVLNEEAARISRALTSGSIEVEFSATSELKSGKTVDRFEVKVDNKHGAGDYMGNSAGERAKIDLCVGLALQRLVASRALTSFNLCFFDEAFDHVDATAHERVVDVLSEINKDSVFVISHSDDLKGFFPNTLSIVKKDGFSRAE